MALGVRGWLRILSIPLDGFLVVFEHALTVSYE